MGKRILPLLFAALCSAQTAPQTRNSFTNRDIVVLAKAGFNEDFILDAMAGARTQFDTTADGLAALAHEGVTETVIRAMMNPPPVKPAETLPAKPAEAQVSVDAAPAKNSKAKEIGRAHV